MASKITCDDLQKLLADHLKGTALEPISERKDYVTGSDGFVASQTIDRLCDMFYQTVRIHKLPNPHRKPEVAQHIVKIEKAIEALQPFKTNA